MLSSFHSRLKRAMYDKICFWCLHVLMLSSFHSRLKRAMYDRTLKTFFDVYMCLCCALSIAVWKERCMIDFFENIFWCLHVLILSSFHSRLNWKERCMIKQWCLHVLMLSSFNSRLKRAMYDRTMRTLFDVYMCLCWAPSIAVWKERSMINYVFDIYCLFVNFGK